MAESWLGFQLISIRPADDLLKELETHMREYEKRKADAK
jgi:hypothetical protein